MSSSNSESNGITFGAALTLWFAFILVMAFAALFYAVYYLIDDSIDKEWTLTRSRIVATWTGESPGTAGELAIKGQSSVIEGSVPGDLNIDTHFRRAFSTIALPIIVLGLLGGWFITFHGLRPLRNLGRTVRHILSTGETSARVPVDSHRGELNELVGLFNQMLEKNDTLMQAMHESLDNVAHDLRTPMARLRGAAEAALQRPDDSEACREALKDCMEESDQVLTMLNTLMDVAEAETGAMPLQREDVRVVEIVRNVVELYEPVAEEKQTTITIEVPEDLEVVADRIRLRQVLANLVDNAIKYSRGGQRVVISARRVNDHVEIAVVDQGIGIPPGDIDKIWNRLFRGDASRTERGLGLGLSFVKAIVEAHGGTVRVESEVDQGARFIVDIPDRPPATV